ncbi:MAG: kinase [Bacteroidales bacterium]|nr:kinase [Bacteroidales bacterium]
MSQLITVKATDGTYFDFIDEVIGSGAMKDVYFSPDHKYVVGFFRNNQDGRSIDRLMNIVGIYRDKIFKQAGGDYFKDYFCWPEKLVEWNGKIGVVCPAYNKKFFFESGMFKGKEKEGKWFASAKLRNKFLPASEKGTWLNYLQICIRIARAVRRLHAAGLAHSDLSYKNVLVDPQTGSACIIDCDGLVVPGKYPPDVAGSPDFIAPEVMQTKTLKVGDPNKALPSIYTDRHALAVLIYMYLLYRHPLRGGKVFNTDPAKDEELAMGKFALFIEHPTDFSNRPNYKQISESEMPQSDIDKRPYTLVGPYLKALFDRAFIEGLHNPEKRPSAAEWEDALVKTADLVVQCNNSKCDSHWFVFNNNEKCQCPFCGAKFKEKVPIFNFYYSKSKGTFRPENYSLVIHDNGPLFTWHVNRYVTPNEKINAKDKVPVGDFHCQRGNWYFVNRSLESLWDFSNSEKKHIKPGEQVELKQGQKLLLTTEEGGRLAIVQFSEN